MNIGRISQNTIQRINDLDLATVVQTYIRTDLKKTGSSYTAISPFTDEKTPSFYVVPSKNLYKCFSSGKGGNSAISFLMDVKGCEFIDAVKTLASDFHIEISYDNVDAETAAKREADHKRFDKVLRAAERQYVKAFQDKPLDYVVNLGYDEYDAAQWGFGYAPNEAKFLTNKLIQSEHYQDGLELGLIGEKDGQAFDQFRARWTLAIQDHLGVLRGFAGRVLQSDSKYPKWINSKDSEWFHKNKLLFGLNHAMKSIQATKTAYLVEGYTDVISMHKVGVTNVVASCGTSFTEDQARLLKRFCTRVKVLFDGDKAGWKNSLRAVEILIGVGLQCEVILLPEGEDPDTLARGFGFHGEESAERLTRWLKSYTYDGIEHFIDCTFDEAHTIHEKQKALDIAAGLIAKIDGALIIDEYVRTIAKAYDFKAQTVKLVVEQAMEAHSRAAERDKYVNRVVKKNRVVKLEGNANVFPFFEEETGKKGEFKGIRINKLKFVKLMASWGYSRFEISNNELSQGEKVYTFVRIDDSIITHVSKETIIDDLEKFILNDYDFVGAGCDVTDAEMLINKFYDGIKTYFNKDLFYRVRQENEIIINRDERDYTYFYYTNGFVQVSKSGYELKPYAEMNGSVWNHQQLPREFQKLDISEALIMKDDIVVDIDKKVAGVFAHFCWLISDQDSERFDALMSIIGYLVHDFYEYKLRAINFTDSSLADEADGRSGKTLLSQMIGRIRSYTEINGKDFNPNDKGKYEDADLGTQVLHLNDVLSVGPNKFLFEYIFNDVTEGYMIKKLYLAPFRNRSKMIISSNSPIDVRGGSQRDRIMEYELSNYFSAERSPEQEYGLWFGRDFDEDEWAKFDNFMCMCAQAFHAYGLRDIKTINLEARKLKQFTSVEFCEFMDEVASNLAAGHAEPYPGYNQLVTALGGSTEWPSDKDISGYRFNKRVLKMCFEKSYEDYATHSYQKWFTAKTWTKWLRYYAEYKMDIKHPKETRSHGHSYIQFVDESA